MSIEVHIEELRAELLACMEKRERRKIERELRLAQARLSALLEPD